MYRFFAPVETEHRNAVQTGSRGKRQRKAAAPRAPRPRPQHPLRSSLAAGPSSQRELTRVVRTVHHTARRHTDAHPKLVTRSATPSCASATPHGHTVSFARSGKAPQPEPPKQPKRKPASQKAGAGGARRRQAGARDAGGGWRAEGQASHRASTSWAGPRDAKVPVQRRGMTIRPSDPRAGLRDAFDDFDLEKKREGLIMETPTG